MDGHNPFAPLCNHWKLLFVGIYREIVSDTRVLNGGGEIDFVHPHGCFAKIK